MDYKAFGLHFETPFIAPELVPITADEAALLSSVHIRYGDVPKQLEKPLNHGPTFEANEAELLMRLPTIGTFFVRNGNEIIIEKEHDCTEDEIRLFLFGSAIGALLQQRGYLTLHASAIATPKGAVLFAGVSGAGKSTLSQEFISRGYKKLSDDTIALYWDEANQKITALPSYPQTKLWHQSAVMLDQSTEGLRKIRPELDKFAIPTFEHFHDTPLALHSMYILSTHTKEEITLEEINGIEKFSVLKNNTYRKKFMEHLPIRKEHFILSSKLAQDHIVKRVIRPKEKNSLRELADIIEKDMQ